MTRHQPRPPKHLEPAREVRVKPKTYQPTRAELEEIIDIRKSDGSKPTPEELARGALGQVKLVVHPKA